MTKKLFWSNITNLPNQTNLLINKHVIPLNYIREENEENLDVKIIDNFNSISNIFITKRFTTGKALKVNKHILKHKRYSNLQLEVPLINNPQISSVFNEFTTSLSFFSKQKKSYISILKIEKGGFTARSFGLLGFLPLNDYKRLNNHQWLNNYKYLKKNLSPSFISKIKTSLKQKSALKPNKQKWKFLKKKWPWANHWKNLKKKSVRKKRIESKLIVKNSEFIKRMLKAKNFNCFFRKDINEIDNDTFMFSTKLSQKAYKNSPFIFCSPSKK